MPDLLNAMTVDVEEHFQVSAFGDVVTRESWDTRPSRVEANTERVLDLLDESAVRATFFVLGWIAERHAGLVRRIAERGHEIGSHGNAHELVYAQRREQFREDVLRSKHVLEEASGGEVVGYRAASFSISRDCLWALDVLAEAGFVYDSSIFPVVHDRYGIPGAPRGAFRMNTGDGRSIVELPPSTVKLAGVVLPVAGGGYLRLYPFAMTRWAIGRLNRDERMPAVVYLHPWEVDPQQPRIRGSWRSRLRHYVGLRTTARKLRRLASRFRFGTMRDVIAESGSIPVRDAL